MAAKPGAAADAEGAEHDAGMPAMDESLAALSPRERLLAVAERMFAEHGLAGVSIRGITAAARVNIASLHYHFGSKEKLLEAIFAARAKPIAEERMRMLAACHEGPGRPPLIEQILEAFLRPALTLGVQPRFGGPAFARLRARLAIEPQQLARRILSRAFDESSRAFLEALAKVLPDLPRAELAWRFHFLLGTMVYSMADSGRIQSITGGDCDPREGEETLRHLIPFLVAGLHAPPAGNSARRGKPPSAAPRKGSVAGRRRR